MVVTKDDEVLEGHHVYKDVDRFGLVALPV